MKKVILLSLGVGLLTAGLSLFVQTQFMSAAISSPSEGTSTPAVAGVGVSFEAPEHPSRLRIPAIGVDAHIQSVGLAWQGTGKMGIPTNFTDVGWYKDGPRPGSPGSAVVAGHLDGRDTPEAVFYNLDQLRPGDLVEVEDASGTVLQFRVIETKIYAQDADSAEVFSTVPSSARLNLVTCTGNWDRSQKLYDQRIVVFTELVTQ